MGPFVWETLRGEKRDPICVHTRVAVNYNSVTGDLLAFGNTFRSEMKNFSGHEVISAFELFVFVLLCISLTVPL